MRIDIESNRVLKSSLCGGKATKCAIASERKYAPSRDIYSIILGRILPHDKSVIENVFALHYTHILGKHGVTSNPYKIRTLLSCMVQLSEIE